jgi:hypothetical protein
MINQRSQKSSTVLQKYYVKIIDTCPLPGGNVPTTAAAFPFWIAISSRCLRNTSALKSPDLDTIRPPITAHASSSADGPHAPKSFDRNWSKYIVPWISQFCVLLSLVYLSCNSCWLRLQWRLVRCEGARVSGKVKSQTKYFPPWRGFLPFMIRVFWYNFGY